jgi:hypothetical protein
MAIRYANKITFRHSKDSGWDVGYEDRETGEFVPLSTGHPTREKAAAAIFEAMARQRAERKIQP